VTFINHPLPGLPPGEGVTIPLRRDKKVGSEK